MLNFEIRKNKSGKYTWTIVDVAAIGNYIKFSAYTEDQLKQTIDRYVNTIKTHPPEIIYFSSIQGCCPKNFAEHIVQALRASGYHDFKVDFGDTAPNSNSKKRGREAYEDQYSADDMGTKMPHDKQLKQNDTQKNGFLLEEKEQEQQHKYEQVILNYMSAQSSQNQNLLCNQQQQNTVLQQPENLKTSPTNFFAHPVVAQQSTATTPIEIEDDAAFCLLEHDEELAAWLQCVDSSMVLANNNNSVATTASNNNAAGASSDLKNTNLKNVYG